MQQEARREKEEAKAEKADILRKNMFLESLAKVEARDSEALPLSLLGLEQHNWCFHWPSHEVIPEAAFASTPRSRLTSCLGEAHLWRRALFPIGMPGFFSHVLVDEASQARRDHGWLSTSSLGEVHIVSRRGSLMA
jgi:hypothetical protein